MGQATPLSKPLLSNNNSHTGLIWPKSPELLSQDLKFLGAPFNQFLHSILYLAGRLPDKCRIWMLPFGSVSELKYFFTLNGNF